MVSVRRIVGDILLGRSPREGDNSSISDRRAFLSALQDPVIRHELLLQEQSGTGEVDFEIVNGELGMRVSFDPPEGVNPLIDREREHIAQQREQFRLNKEKG